MMPVIYLITNKINGKRYVGQAKNWTTRYRHYRSNPFNPKSKDYSRPINRAIRKYGLNNFNFTIIENIDNEEGQDYIDERERFFIQHYKSLTTDQGYNIRLGGIGGTCPPLTFEQCLNLSKKFTPSNIVEIQSRLLKQDSYDNIFNDFPQLTRTFLSNINNGKNFHNPELKYPLKTEFKHESIFTEENQQAIKNDIKTGMIYRKIMKKWGIKNISLLSSINSGNCWHDKKEKYPLVNKGCRKQDNLEWVLAITEDLLGSSLSIAQICKKHSKSKTTVAKINKGHAHKQPKLSYPLRPLQAD